MLKDVNELKPKVVSCVPAKLKTILNKEYSGCLTVENFFLGMSQEEDELLCTKLVRKYFPERQHNNENVKVVQDAMKRIINERKRKLIVDRKPFPESIKSK